MLGARTTTRVLVTGVAAAVLITGCGSQARVTVDAGDGEQGGGRKVAGPATPAPTQTSATTTDASSAPAATSVTTAPTASTSSTAAVPAAPVDCAKAKCVALTYDDGPGPYTDKLLDELAALDAPATFYVIGKNVQADPAPVKRAVDMGMEIGDHTWNHVDLHRLGGPAQKKELDSTADAVEKASGFRPTTMRPPYGSYNAATTKLGYSIIYWDVDTEDWKNRNQAMTTKRALATVHPGAIILMHDIRPTSVAATPDIVKALRAKGYTLVTVSQLLGTPKPGKVYFSR